MSTATIARPRGGFAESAGAASEFAGMWRLLRLYLRRDRIVLPLWVLVLSVPLGSVYIKSIQKVYSGQAGLESFQHAVNSSPAQLAMYGPLYAANLGAAGVWKAGAFDSLIAIATILTVIRHTRAEEETGREELLASTRVGRLAGLTAALIMTCSASLLTGLIAAASIRGAGVGGGGALAFGLAEAGCGIVFAAVAAVTAQLSSNARTTRGIAFAVLAVTFVLRAVGDARDVTGPTSPLVWFSPQGWAVQMRPYAGDHFQILLLFVLLAAVLVAVAYALLRRRDLGAGLIAERPGAAAAGPRLAGPLGLAWRLQRGTLIAWTAGLALYGLLIGSVTHGVAGEFGNSKVMNDIIARLGGARGLEDSFLAIAFAMVGLMAAAYSISAALRMHSEESADRAESVLTAAVGRIRWAASHLVLAIGGPALALLISGLLAGLLYGAAMNDMGQVGRVLSAALIQLPAVWLFAAASVLLFGLLPRWTTVAWGVFVAGVALYLLGSISGMPQWVLDLDPYSHLPKLPSEPFRATPVVILLVIDIVLIAVGLVGLRRRDLR
jgi:ABC-2 type transport system permease protein